MPSSAPAPALSTSPLRAPARRVRSRRAVAARIIGAAPREGRWIRRLFTRPESGQLVAAESRQRCFPSGVARIVALLHPTCRTAWCDAPVAQIDHVRDAADGGRTSMANAQGLCQACNLAKSRPGWRASPVGEGTGPPAVVVTETPTGHRYWSSSGPPTASAIGSGAGHARGTEGSMS